MPTAGVVAAAVAVTACYPAGEMAAFVPLFLFVLPSFNAVFLDLLSVFLSNSSFITLIFFFPFSVTFISLY